MAQLPVLNNTRGGGPVRGTLAEAAHARTNRSTVALDRVALSHALTDLLSSGAPPHGAGGEVRFSEHDRLLYSTDASLYQVEPIGVVVPASVDDAERVVRFCGERGVAMLPRGGGTSLAGQCTNHAVVIDLTPACRRVVSVDPQTATCVVEPGIGIDELNAELVRRGHALFFAPDPATTRQAAIGGCVGNNAAGARSIRYGRTSENVERLNVVLATGERLWLGPDAGKVNPTALRLAQGVARIVETNANAIRARFPRTVRRNAGYGLDMILDQLEAGATPETLDLSKLLCGSEGTLAVTLQAELKLHPLPTTKGLAVVSFATLEDAISATQPILDRCLSLGLTAVELLDDVVLEAARGNSDARAYVDLLPGARAERNEPKAVLYIEFFAFAQGEAGKQEIQRGFDAVRELMAQMPGVIPNGIAAYTDTGAMLKAWSLRKAGEPLLHGLPGPLKPITFVEDNAVPVEKLIEFVHEFKRIVTKHGTRAAYWAHASVGVLHVRPMIDLHDPADRERMIAIAVEVADLARSVGGIMSGEHGDGRVRGPLLERFFGPELMLAFRQIKALFDPQGLLNPGNIVAPGPVSSITEHLRVDQPEQNTSGTGGESPQASHAPRAPHSHTPNIQTFYDYSDSEGFGHAIEQCNGAGVCRKRGGGGVMCPSYHATLDERHSTRGRGNALRLAITGQFAASSGLPAGTPQWQDPETKRTLDLCLSCKACKSECPSNVDIARLKAEYTAQGYREAGREPLSALATGHIRWLNRIGALTPTLANWLNSTRPARAIIDHMMKLDPRRSLPRFSRSLFSRRDEFAASNTASSPRNDAPRVLLFSDCFSTYNESQIGVAAGRVLTRLGYRVELIDQGCCGRSMISVGMLPQAIETIDATLERLSPFIDDPGVVGVLVIEPSCLSAIKDDWLSLKCRTPLALRKALAAKSMLVEEFVDTRWASHPKPPTLAPKDEGESSSASVLLHAHCHQKALWGAESSARLLRRVVGDRLKVLDTGCCGMAGSFGYTRERFDLSMSIANLSLLPALREAAPESIVLAPGTSCRHQVHDGAHRTALHPIELVEKMLA